MRVEEAIKKAIENGWKPGGIAIEPIQKVLSHYAENWEYPTIDPSFWRSLGKVLGWCDIDLPQPMYKLGELHEVGKIWLYNWHRFIDHLADGKTAEEFFAELS